MRTEEEAKVMSCPIAKDRCISSKCMMWRWGTEVTERGITIQSRRETGERWSCDDCNGEGKHHKYVTEENTEGWCPECEGAGNGFRFARIGFCGLAGVPSE